MAGRGSVTAQDEDDARLAADAATAALAAARAELEELRAGPRPERLAAGRAEVMRAAAELRSAEVDLENSTLTAPFAGTVGARLADEGDVPAAGAAVLELLETAAPRLRAGVGGPDAGEFAVGPDAAPATDRRRPPRGRTAPHRRRDRVRPRPPRRRRITGRRRHPPPRPGAAGEVGHRVPPRLTRCPNTTTRPADRGLRASSAPAPCWRKHITKAGAMEAATGRDRRRPKW